MINTQYEQHKAACFYICINIKTGLCYASLNPTKLHPFKLISPFSLQILLRRGIGHNDNCPKVRVENYPLTLFYVVGGGAL